MKLERSDLGRLLLALAAIAGAWWIVADAPFLSEDWTHLATARGDAGWTSALDPAREPLRPLQHLFFHVLARFDAPDPTAARGVSFALHAIACAIVFALALEFRAGPRAASWAALLFALAPNVKGVAWSAAISTPGRALFVLLGLLCFARALRTCSRPAAAGAIVSFGLALAFHESAVVLPVLCLAWAACADDRAMRFVDRLRAAFSALRRPELAIVALAAAAYVVYVAFLRPERHHGLKSLASLPANAVKAGLAIFPEGLRSGVVESLREHPGAAGLAAGAALFVVLGALAAWSLARGDRIARFAVVAIAIDLVLPVIGAGFVQRYAYLCFALAAVALASWATRSARRTPVFVVTAIGGAWLFDAFVDAREYAEAGQRARSLVEAACTARSTAPAARPVAIVDPPDVLGAERDVPVFNWGLASALESAGCASGFVLWRTRAFATSTDVELVTAERVRSAAASGEVVLIDASRLPAPPE